jgi:hypothetical protein
MSHRDSLSAKEASESLVAIICKSLMDKPLNIAKKFDVEGKENHLRTSVKQAILRLVSSFSADKSSEYILKTDPLISVVETHLYESADTLDE